MIDPLKPGLSLLAKLGSIAVHVQEMESYHFDPTNRAFSYDLAALKSLLDDGAVKDWLRELDKMAVLPKKR